MNITVPTSWEDITIKQFIELHALNDVEAEGFIEQVEKKIKELSVLTSQPEDIFYRIPSEQLKELFAKLSFLTSLPSEVFDKEVIINGIKYVPELFVNKLITGRYVDLMKLTEDPERIIENLHKIMAVLFLPVIDGKVQEYDTESYQKRCDEFYNHMPVTIAYPTAVFFCRVWDTLMPVIEDFLKSRMRSLSQTNKNSESTAS